MEVKLSEICNPKQWKTIPTSELMTEGYPVYGANGIIGYYNEYDVQEFDIYINAIRAILLNIKSDKYFDDFIYKGNLYAKKEIDFIYYINRFLERDNYYFINNLNYLYDFIDSFGYIWRFEERIMAKGDRLMKKRNKTFKYIDDEFLCEIYFADSIEKNPYQPIIDSD